MNDRSQLSPSRSGVLAQDSPPPAEAGITMVEVIVILAVISILALIIIPRVACVIEKSHMSKMASELSHARDSIEAYELELGKWPPDLSDAFGGRPVPTELVYCTDAGDANAGHGNEWCSFFDNANPSGGNEHGGMPGVGYILATPAALAAKCQNVNFIYTTCCGTDPITVHCDEDVDIGHPGKTNFGSCGGG